MLSDTCTDESVSGNVKQRRDASEIHSTHPCFPGTREVMHFTLLLPPPFPPLPLPSFLPSLSFIASFPPTVIWSNHGCERCPWGDCLSSIRICGVRKLVCTSVKLSNDELPWSLLVSEDLYLIPLPDSLNLSLLICPPRLCLLQAACLC